MGYIILSIAEGKERPRKTQKAEAEHRKAVKAKAEELGFVYIKKERCFSHPDISPDSFWCFDLYKIEDPEKIILALWKMAWQ